VKVTELEIPGVLMVELDVFRDNRGFFTERFHLGRFREHHLSTNIVQVNHSRSSPGVVRGLHYQSDPPQGKLVGVTRGRIWDVIVDIRATSPSFGRHLGVELSDDNGRLLWVPPGFAHGFCVMGNDSADLLYQVDAPYNPKSDSGIAWNDPDLHVSWPERDLQCSPRDAQQPRWADYIRSPAFG
jgi:dTDP-4-dehydrorhamnose 3,5-epimerase